MKLLESIKNQTKSTPGQAIDLLIKTNQINTFSEYSIPIKKSNITRLNYLIDNAFIKGHEVNDAQRYYFFQVTSHGKKLLRLIGY